MTSRVRRLAAKARDVLYPRLPAPSPELVQADSAAQRIWIDVFEPMDPTVSGADVLEVGCRDGRLLAALLAQHEPARSAIGVENSCSWRGENGSPAWDPASFGAALELHGDLRVLEALDPGSFDLILCRDFESIFSVENVEGGLRRLYDLMRPGGEIIIHLGCGSGRALETHGPGYGFLTPTSWMMLLMRAGFEVDAVRPLWRNETEYAPMTTRLPFSSDQERLTAAMVCRLLRPWESWELDRVWAGKEGV